MLLTSQCLHYVGCWFSLCQLSGFAIKKNFELLVKKPVCLRENTQTAPFVRAQSLSLGSLGRWTGGRGLQGSSAGEITAGTVLPFGSQVLVAVRCYDGCAIQSHKPDTTLAELREATALLRMDLCGPLYLD